MVAARLALCYSHTRSHILAILSCNGDLQYLFANSICERSHSHYPKSIVEVCRSSSQDRRFRAIALLRKSVRRVRDLSETRATRSGRSCTVLLANLNSHPSLAGLDLAFSKIASLVGLRPRCSSAHQVADFPRS